MTTVPGYFGCSSTVKMSAPDTIRHNRPVHTTKALVAFSVFLRAQEWKATIRTDGPFFRDGVLREFVLRIAAGADQTGCTFLGRLGIRLGFSCSHKASGAVLNGRCLRTCVQALPVMLTRFQSNCHQGKFFCSARRLQDKIFISTCP